VVRDAAGSISCCSRSGVQLYKGGKGRKWQSDVPIFAQQDNVGDQKELEAERELGEQVGGNEQISVSVYRALLGFVPRAS
jgi:hypothetical protein